jgi:tetratricopeptide (TPR) repeat protein
MAETEEEMFAAYRLGQNLSQDQVHILERQLIEDPAQNVTRAKLFGYFDKRKHSSKEAQVAFCRLAAWLIENQPDNRGLLSYRMDRIAHYCSPKEFRQIREKWLEQVEKHPKNPAVHGNAARCIIWRDLETAEKLLRKAHQLEPNNGEWPSLLTLFSYFEFTRVPPFYQAHYAQLTIEMGKIAIALGPPAPFLDLEYMADCALFLGDLDLCESCAHSLLALKLPSGGNQIAHVMLGLVALGKNDRQEAVRQLLRMEKGYESNPWTWRLAKELYGHGERQSIIECIRLYEHKVSKKIRQRWISLIEQDQMPDFSEV